MSVCPLIIHENDRDLYIKGIYDIVITYGGYMNIESIEDVEIYEISANVLSSITNDINNSIYKELGGNLSFSWVAMETVTAWAESPGDLNTPPNHKINSGAFSNFFISNSDRYSILAIK